MQAESSVGAQNITEVLSDTLEKDAPAVIEEVSPHETMHAMNDGGDLQGYLETGQWALKRIRVALLAAKKREVKSILDLPSGYGRMLRALKAEFPDAKLTACDIDHGAVDFCAETFGAVPAYGREDPREVEIEGPVDLIWCGSLFTHLNRKGWIRFLKLFESLLEPGGVLVFTTQGRFVADKVFSDPTDPVQCYGMNEEQVGLLKRTFAKKGFAFCDYTFKDYLDTLSLPHEYGIALASPSWVCSTLEKEAPKLDLLTYTAGGYGPRWGGSRAANGLNPQDMVSCIRLQDDQV